MHYHNPVGDIRLSWDLEAKCIFLKIAAESKKLQVRAYVPSLSRHKPVNNPSEKKKKIKKERKLTIFNMFCGAQIKMSFSLTEKLSFYLRPLFSIRLQREKKKSRKVFCRKDLGFIGQCAEGQQTRFCDQSSLCTAIHMIWQWWLTSKATVQIIPFSMPSTAKASP